MATCYQAGYCDGEECYKTQINSIYENLTSFQQRCSCFPLDLEQEQPCSQSLFNYILLRDVEDCEKAPYSVIKVIASVVTSIYVILPLVVAVVFYLLDRATRGDELTPAGS